MTTDTTITATAAPELKQLKVSTLKHWVAWLAGFVSFKLAGIFGVATLVCGILAYEAVRDNRAGRATAYTIGVFLSAICWVVAAAVVAS